MLFLFFFQENFLNLFRLKLAFLRFCFYFMFKFSSLLLLKGKQTPLSNSKSLKITKNERLLASKVDFNFSVSQLLIHYLHLRSA